MKLPVIDKIHILSKMFATGVKDMATGDSKRETSLTCTIVLVGLKSSCMTSVQYKN